MKKLKFRRDNDILVTVMEGKHEVGEIVSLDGKFFLFESGIGVSISESDLRQIAKYMKSLRTANLPKTEADESGPVVTGTLKAEKPHTMTPGFVAQEPKVAAFTTGPDGKVTVSYDVQQRGTVTQYATAASSRMVMPGTASIRFVIENRDYTLDITGVIVGENASVELRQENDTWSLG